MYKTNSIGPSTEPWETPQGIESVEDLKFPIVALKLKVIKFNRALSDRSPHIGGLTGHVDQVHYQCSLSHQIFASYLINLTRPAFGFGNGLHRYGRPSVLEQQFKTNYSAKLTQLPKNSSTSFKIIEICFSARQALHYLKFRCILNLSILPTVRLYHA